VDIQCVPGGWRDGVLLEGGSTNRTVSPPNQAGYYYFDDSTGKGTITAGLGSLPSGGTSMVFKYTAQFPFTVTATSGASPVIQFQDTRPDHKRLGPAQLEANGMLTMTNQNPRELTFKTLEIGFSPNQSMTVTLSNKNLSAVTVQIVQVTSVLTEFQDTF